MIISAFQTSSRTVAALLPVINVSSSLLLYLRQVTSPALAKAAADPQMASLVSRSHTTTLITNATSQNQHYTLFSSFSTSLTQKYILSTLYSYRFCPCTFFGVGNFLERRCYPRLSVSHPGSRFSGELS